MDIILYNIILYYIIFFKKYLIFLKTLLSLSDFLSATACYKPDVIDINTHGVSGYTIATQYLRNLQISEAEMTQYLCNIKMATTNALTKKYNVPFFSYVLQDKTVNKYLKRAARFKSLTFTQYIK